MDHKEMFDDVMTVMKTNPVRRKRFIITCGGSPSVLFEEILAMAPKREVEHCNWLRENRAYCEQELAALIGLG